MNVFYCVKCDQLVATDQASMLFRTGFYLNEYPLGCCLDCFPKSKQQAVEEEPDFLLKEKAAIMKK